MTVMRERRNVKRRVLMVVAGVLVLFLAGGTAGYAYWQMQGNTTITVSAYKIPQDVWLTCRKIPEGLMFEFGAEPKDDLTHFRLLYRVSTMDSKAVRHNFIDKELPPDSTSYIYRTEEFPGNREILQALRNGKGNIFVSMRLDAFYKDGSKVSDTVSDRWLRSLSFRFGLPCLRSR